MQIISTTASGRPDDPIGNGLSLNLDYSAYPIEQVLGAEIGPDVADTFTASTNATASPNAKQRTADAT